MEANVLSLDGKAKGKMPVPPIFETEVKPELIRRAVIAENTLNFQPQGHYLLAGMQTSARYYGRMQSYRTGRHMGRAIRPRQKLGGGSQGEVRRIPSSTKGKRAHPHLVEKTIIERINRREYQMALASAVSATKSDNAPLVVADEIESIAKTKEMFNIFKRLNVSKGIAEKPKIRKGLRRSSKRKQYRKSVLLVLGSNASAIKAARNIAGVDACAASDIRANLLAPGGVPGRVTVWSENAIKSIEESVKSKSL
ncbi:MAG: 50S ribosomal protein L4 [Candidatus Micrarchaeaceae archaeon]